MKLNILFKVALLGLVLCIIPQKLFATSAATDDDEENCTRLPPKPYSPSTNSSINLLSLLVKGSQLISFNSTNEAILMLGNTGSGKTTTTQTIAGDLKRLHAVLTSSDSLVIVDDDNRIGAPSTVSKTLFPELITSQSLSIFDCPGFDDTRGPEIDIAANYFLNQVIKSVSNAKLLFTVIHSSVKLGNDRLDFDLLAEHATKFIKNIPKYQNSIGLVVTKVNSFSGRGKYLSDSKILGEIVEFILLYNQTLHSKLNGADQIEKAFIQRKILFTAALLQKDALGNYFKLAFSRDPEKCGALSHSSNVVKTKQMVTNLIGKLTFERVEPKYFGYSLKASSSLYIHDTVREINEMVERNVRSVSKNFWQVQIDKLKKQTDVSQIVQKVDGFNSQMTLLKSSLTRLSSRGLLGLSVTLKNSFVQMGYNVPKNFTDFMEINEKVLVFFDEAEGSKVRRNWEDWRQSLDEMKVGFKKYEVWFKFCLDLQRKVFSYEFQGEKAKYQVGGGNVKQDWLEFLERNQIIYVSTALKDLGKVIDDFAINALDKIMIFGMAKTNTVCNGVDAVAYGNFVSLSEINGVISKCAGNRKRLTVLGADSVFIDEDIWAVGKELEVSLISPKWSVIGKHRINLDGDNGKDIGAFKGNSSARAFGENGRNGTAGLPGGAGGVFLGFGESFENSKNLVISANGGNGGKGQDGDNGTDGKNGRDATKSDTSRSDWGTVLWVTGTKWEHEGFPGQPGGNGGDGGIGGNAGEPGDIKIIGRDHPSVKIEMRKGGVSMSGKGGYGGNGGKPGEAYACRYTYLFFLPVSENCYKNNYNYHKAANGTNGIDGKSSLDMRLAKPANKIDSQSKSKLIADFKQKFSGNGHILTSNFINNFLKNI